MRMTIDIDEALMTAAQKAAGLDTKRGTVEEALRLLVSVRAQQAAGAALFGKFKWEGNLAESRRSRVPKIYRLRRKL